jgi:hypothetical protein
VAAHVWGWFWQLSQRRTAGFDSPNPISWTEIQAWRELTRAMILPEEIDLILMMDSAWLEAVAQHREEQKDKK